MPCQNPFFKCTSKNNKTAIIIKLNGQDREICDTCWQKIADSDIEWTNPEVKVEPEKEERATKITINGVDVPLKKFQAL